MKFFTLMSVMNSQKYLLQTIFKQKIRLSFKNSNICYEEIYLKA